MKLLHVLYIHRNLEIYVSERSGAFAVAGPGYMGPMGSKEDIPLSAEKHEFETDNFVLRCYELLDIVQTYFILILTFLFLYETMYFS